MDWAKGIGVSDRAFVGELRQTDGSTVQVPLGDLVTRGLPTAGASRLRVESDLRTWVPADPARYRSAFGIADHPGCPENHQVFSFNVKDVEVLVPALALMRAFFRPKKYLLPAMFGPQALDRVCHLDHSASPPVLVIDAFWASQGYCCRQGELAQPLSWLQSFPSAAGMAASVHSAAVDGRIGIDLPECTFRGVVTGFRLGNALVVTQLNIVELLALEAPFEFASGHSLRVAFHDVAPDQTKGRRTRIKADTAIPRRYDGGIEVIDSEWEVLRPLLLEGVHEKKIGLDQRGIFNGVLAKLADGASWRKAKYTDGNWNNARYAYRRWVERGVFQKAIETLVGLRGCEVKHDS